MAANFESMSDSLSEILSDFPSNNSLSLTSEVVPVGVAEIDALLDNFTSGANATAPLSPVHSPSDLEMDYSGPEFSLDEGVPNLVESDTDSSSYYHGSCSDLSEHDTHDDESLDELGLTKKYRQPASLKAVNLQIGPWRLSEALEAKEGSDSFSLEVKFLFGRRKIKYELLQPNSKKSLILDYDLSQISGLKFYSKEKILTFVLSEPPNFSSKERGKCNKIPDFTQGHASRYQRHVIMLASDHPYDEQYEKLLQSDRRLRQLSELSITALESSTFSNDDSEYIPTTVCDWDRENSAAVFCGDCNANYCEDCDDVLHRHATRKAHKRIPISSPLTKPKKNKKRKKSDRCRCGTGATKGTLGDPCTGNRCPCYSSGKGCSGCGCKNCSNPYKKKPERSNSQSSLGMSRDTPVAITQL